MPVRIKNLPSYKQVSDLLSYHPATGTLKWNFPRTKKEVRKVGSYQHGRLRVGLFGQTYHAHRICWFLYYGVEPVFMIDHVNGDPSDNRIENLREATVYNNQHNKGRQKNNVSGFKGVCWNSDSRKWQAGIKVQRKSIHLGLFNTPEQAHAAYAEAARKYFGEFARRA